MEMEEKSCVQETVIVAGPGNGRGGAFAMMSLLPAQRGDPRCRRDLCIHGQWSAGSGRLSCLIIFEFMAGRVL